MKKQQQPNPKTSPTPQGNSFAWHHVRATVPADWEVSAYSVEDRTGRLEFNTRQGLQGIVSWEPCNREPDRLTTMATFLANHIIGKKNPRKLRTTDILTSEVGRFLVGWVDETMPCQAMGYDARGGHLIRWVFEGHTSKVDRETLIRPILESCDFNDDEDACEYNLHGIHCSLPWDYKIEDIIVLPANVMMSFESEDSKRRAIFRRWGLADMVLGKQDLTSFYKPILRTHSIEVESCTPCHVSGCDARQLTFNAPREFHSDRFMRRRWTNGKAVVWHDAKANRVYTFEQIGPDDSQELEFSEVIRGLTIEAAN